MSHTSGNRNGRRLYPTGTQTRKVQVVLSDEDYEAARKLGEGYAASGVRRLVIRYRRQDRSRANGL